MASRSDANRPPVIDKLSLLETAERVAGLGSWEWRPRQDTRLWSDNLFRLSGFQPGDATPSREFFLQRTHPDDRERLQRYAETSRWLETPPPIEFRIQHRTLGIRHLRSTIAKVEFDRRGATRIVGAIQDVTDELLTQREIAAHLAVSKTLAEWGSLERGTIDLLGELGIALEFAFGALWLPRDLVLVPTVMWCEPRDELDEIAAVTATLQLTSGTGLPGQAWRSKQPETLSDVNRDDVFRRRLIAGRAGLRGAIAFPAIHSDEVIAVLEFYHRGDLATIDRLTRTLVAIGRELGEFFSRRGGELASQRLTDRQLDVLSLAAAGNTTPQIATELGLSSSTVRTHFDHLYEKLGVADRAAAVAQGLRLGLID
jgi:DNA-binding CsgD family transcriptional regulator